MTYRNKLRFITGSVALPVVLAAVVLGGIAQSAFAKQVNAHASAQVSVTDDLLCPVTAFGHLVAPGWMKKNGTTTVPEDCSLPRGISRLLGRTPPSDGGGGNQDDVTAPDISNIHVDATTTSAHIMWNTNEQANSAVYYGTSSPVVIGDDETSVESNGSLVLHHSLMLNDLEASTTYYVLVVSADDAHNTSTSSQLSFTTGEVGDNVAPIIEDIVILRTDATSTITWHTDEDSDSAVFFGTTTPLAINASSTGVVESGTLLNDHTIVLSDLDASTTYYVIIRSRDADGNVGLSTEHSFTTLAAPDVTAPLISSLATVVGSTTLDVSWMTNEPATTKVYFSTSTPVDLGSASTTLNSSLVLSHDALVTGLSSDTTYHLILESKDAANNIRQTDEFSVHTATST
jgi:hypothetical protein